MISQTTSEPISLTQSQDVSAELVAEIKKAIEGHLRLTLLVIWTTQPEGKCGRRPALWFVKK